GATLHGRSPLCRHPAPTGGDPTPREPMLRIGDMNFPPRRCGFAQRSTLVRPLRRDRSEIPLHKDASAIVWRVPHGACYGHFQQTRIALMVQGHKGWVFAGIVFGVALEATRLPT